MCVYVNTVKACSTNSLSRVNRLSSIFIVVWKKDKFTW